MTPRSVKTLWASAGIALVLISLALWRTFPSTGGTPSVVPERRTIDAKRKLVSVDRAGNTLALIENEHAFAYPRFSPNGAMLAVMILNGIEPIVPTMPGGADIWILEFSTKTLRRFTFDGRSFFPTWSPDSTQVAFVSRSDDSWKLLVRAADGRGDALPLRESKVYFEPTAWSSDGERIFFNQRDPSSDWDVWMLRFPQLSVEPLLQTDQSETHAEPSPDGRWVTFIADDALFVASLEHPSERWQLAAGPASESSWHSDGSEVFFRDGATLLSAEVRLEPSFSASPPVPQFIDKFESLAGGYRNFAVSVESSRFIFIQGPVDGSP